MQQALQRDFCFNVQVVHLVVGILVRALICLVQLGKVDRLCCRVTIRQFVDFMMCQQHVQITFSQSADCKQICKSLYIDR